ncbi:nitrous oxide reductase accessory protein NosL [Nitratifractor sp.]|uniref:nitrous oxide reductase accessory protein NosL n=1 Tax=Nitratifractor sp. TaxID=2268144 RepID=UPI0025EDB87F|nr:nitrous oxide reductase accessory protein NosL [Nitratifractor sp.]
MKRLTFFMLIGLLLSGTAVMAEEGNTTIPLVQTAPAASGWSNGLDPVYAIPLDKLPKFTAEMVLKNGKKIRFASVKAMLNFYYHPEKYPLYKVRSRKAVKTMFVQDYLSGEKIPLQKAWYVFGSRLMGPHGDDLIPLSSRTRAELFVKRYGGTKIMSFQEVGDKGYGLVHYLDMM